MKKRVDCGGGCGFPLALRALCSLGKHYSVLQTKKYDIAHVVIDVYIPTKFHGFISFGF